MRKPILVALVVTAAIAGAVLAMGPSNASACNTAETEICILQPSLEGDTRTGPIIMVTVEVEVPIVTVDIYGPVLVTDSDPAPMFTAPITMITTGRTGR